jgi:ABC-2 type transport system permease protein
MIDTQSVRAIARLDLRQRIRSRHLQVAVVMMWLIALGVVLVASLSHGQTSAVTYRYGTVGPPPSLLSALSKPPPGTHTQFLAEPDAATAEAAVRSGALTAAVTNGHIVAKSDTTSPGVVLLRDLAARAALVQRLEQTGVDQADAVHTAGQPDIIALTPPKPTRLRSTAAVLAIAVPVPTAAVTMYLMIFVSTSIQEERGTRMADMLLIPLRAIEIVAGKVLSTELLAAIVLAIVGGSSAALAVALHGTHIAGEAPYTLAALAMWFLLQSALYFFAAAAAGATVAGFVETQLVVLAFGSVAIFCAVTSTAVVAFPTSPASTVLSLLPPFSFSAMLIRTSTSHVPLWQPLTAVILAVAAITWTAQAAAAVYQGAVAASAADRISMLRAYHAGRDMMPRHHLDRR